MSVPTLRSQQRCKYFLNTTNIFSWHDVSGPEQGVQVRAGVERVPAGGAGGAHRVAARARGHGHRWHQRRSREYNLSILKIPRFGI